MNEDTISTPFLYLYSKPATCRGLHVPQLFRHMKKLKLWLLSLVTVMSATALTACGGDDDEPGNPNVPDKPTVTDKDPEGTIIANMLCDDTRIILEGPQGREYYTFWLTIGNDLNWCDDNHGHRDIADVGAVNNISAITTIPESGWGEPAVQPGHGYIVRVRGWGDQWDGSQYIRHYSYEYHRIYVTKYLTSAGGSTIIGATVKYQPNWKTSEDFIWQ